MAICDQPRTPPVPSGQGPIAEGPARGPWPPLRDHQSEGLADTVSPPVRSIALECKRWKCLDAQVADGKKGSAREFLSLEDHALLEQCSVDHYRASGPGGQKRNKTSSAVRLRHHPTGLSVTATDDRSQHVNRRRALRRLRQAIALHTRAPIDLEQYERTPLLSSCVSHAGRLAVGRRDHRYFAAVCEVLDVLWACDLRVGEAARRLGITTANLVKFMQNDPKVWERANQMRAAAGRPRLTVGG